MGLPCHDFQRLVDVDVHVPHGTSEAPATDQPTPSGDVNGNSTSAVAASSTVGIGTGAAAGSEVVLTLRERSPHPLWTRLARLIAPVWAVLAAPTALLGGGGDRSREADYAVGGWVPLGPGGPGTGGGAGGGRRTSE